MRDRKRSWTRGDFRSLTAVRANSGNTLGERRLTHLFRGVTSNDLQNCSSSWIEGEACFESGKRISIMGCVERDREIKRRRARRVKLKKLRELYGKSTNEGEKAMLLARARKISPMFSFEE